MKCSEAAWNFLVLRAGQLEYAIHEVLQEPKHPLRAEVLSMLNGVDRARLADTRSRPIFAALRGYRSNKQQEEHARVFCIVDELSSDFESTRLRLLANHGRRLRPAPYERPPLAHVSIDEDHLVPIRPDSVTDGGGVVVDDFVCQVAQTRPGTNSMFWTMDELVKLTGCQVRVRLDPLLVCPKQNYEPMFYRMLTYGVPLDWQRLGTLRQELHCRWQDDNDRDLVFTDVVWTPRDDGIHFQCEEVPKPEFASVRGARYFHSIYDPHEQKMVHADGALRIYSREALEARLAMHLRKTGKAGVRVKVFKVDGEITPKAWTSLLAAYFVWNDDIQKYATGTEADFEAT